ELISKTKEAAKLSSDMALNHTNLVITMFIDFKDTSQSTNNEVQLAGMHSDLVNRYDKLPECENSYLSVCHVDENTDANIIRLKVDDIFENWVEVDITINKYGKQNGFVTIKYCKDLDPANKTIKSETNKQKKVKDINLHCDTISNKMGCLWEVSFYYRKIKLEICFTKINESYNYKCDPITIDLAPKNAHLPQPIVDKIKYYATNGHLNTVYELWARYSINKIFTAGVESIQRVESINSIFKKHLDHGTLLKKLVKVIKSELDKEAEYSYIRNYYGSNVAIGLPSTYHTIFKDIDLVLKDYLTPITFPNEIVKHIYDMPQIKLQDLLSGVDSNDIQKIWEVSYITGNVYTSPIRNKVNKRIKFCTTMSVARTSVQVAMAEDVTAKLNRLLTQFLMKYYHSTELNIKEVYYSILQSNEIQELFFIVAN
ncbi:15935_t:CDS:2, partial [Gigaspora margarita]